MSVVAVGSSTSASKTIAAPGAEYVCPSTASHGGYKFAIEQLGGDLKISRSDIGCPAGYTKYEAHRSTRHGDVCRVSKTNGGWACPLAITDMLITNMLITNMLIANMLGDVCRVSKTNGGWACPLGCARQNGAPYGESWTRY